MIVQPKQQNQNHPEYLYSWYPEGIDESVSTTSIDSRTIYSHGGLDKDLLEQKSSTNECKKNQDVENREQKKNSTYFFSLFLFEFIHLIVVVTSAYNNSNKSADLLQRYKESIAPSDRAYHSAETIDEALNPPWALQYEIKRRAATPNLPSNSTNSTSN
jgi:hypothetical protein